MNYSLTMTDKKSAQICIRVEPEVYKKLKNHAESEDRSVGYLVRRMINEGIEKREAKKSDRIKKTTNNK